MSSTPGVRGASRAGGSGSSSPRTPLAAHQQADLAGQLDGVVVDRYEQAVGEQPAHGGVGGLRRRRALGVLDAPQRRAGRQRVEHPALGRSPRARAARRAAPGRRTGRRARRPRRRRATAATGATSLTRSRASREATGRPRPAATGATTSRTGPTTCSADGGPHTSARSCSRSTAAVDLRVGGGVADQLAQLVLRRRGASPEDSTSPSSSASTKASSCSSARSTDSRTAARAARTPTSGGTGTARSGRATSSAARRSSGQPRSQSARLRAADSIRTRLAAGPWVGTGHDRCRTSGC